MDSKAKIVYENYLQRFFIHPFSHQGRLPEVEYYVVIPAYSEEGLEQTLTSLANCDVPGGGVCVLVVLNEKEGDPLADSERNLRYIQVLESYNHRFSSIHWRWIHATSLGGKNAGVGLARKIGMDAVVVQCAQTGLNPFMICLDADCEVARDYLEKIHQVVTSSHAEVAVFEFEHRLEAIDDPDLRNGILQYEVFLEYYRLGLVVAGYPFCYHTVGSSMACRALAYAKSGGMNQRKAGEDFYFLHKLFPHYKTVEIPGPLVFPSPRISHRVPFGTGRFQQKWKEEERTSHLSYHPDVFLILEAFLDVCLKVVQMAEASVTEQTFHSFCRVHPMANQVLDEMKVNQELNRVIRSSRQPAQRMKAFFRWFDGLKALKFIHRFAGTYPSLPPMESIGRLRPHLAHLTDPKELVFELRKYLYQIQFGAHT